MRIIGATSYRTGGLSYSHATEMTTASACTWAGREQDKSVVAAAVPTGLIGLSTSFSYVTAVESTC